MKYLTLCALMMCPLLSFATEYTLVNASNYQLVYDKKKNGDGTYGSCDNSAKEPLSAGPGGTITFSANTDWDDCDWIFRGYKIMNPDNKNDPYVAYLSVNLSHDPQTEGGWLYSSFVSWTNNPICGYQWYTGTTGAFNMNELTMETCPKQ